MTGRERLLTALNCGTPDRVPINTYELAGFNSQDWYNQQPSYRDLMELVRTHTDCITNWAPSFREEAMGDNYMCATGFLCSAHACPVTRSQETSGTRTRTTTVLHTPRGDLRRVEEVDSTLCTTWVLEHWCKTPQDVDLALSVPYEPMHYDASDLPRVRGELGDRGLVMASLGDPAYLVADLMSFQDYVLWLHEDTDHFARAVDIVAPRVMQNLAHMLDAAVVDLYRICGPEYMTPPYARPAMFQRFMVPHVRAMTQLIHQRGSKVRLHCHGRIAQVLDLFFETGVDGTDPCEPPPDGDLELDEVKRRCLAHHVSVWGNTELKVLEHGSPQQVRESVAQVMRQGKDGGGFVLLPTAAPINVPLAEQTLNNYRTWMETALEMGRY
jgi:uroporphyrinogen-III decarboxylase